MLTYLPVHGQVTMDDAEYQRRAPEITLALAAPHVRDVFEVRLRGCSACSLYTLKAISLCF